MFVQSVSPLSILIAGFVQTVQYEKLFSIFLFKFGRNIVSISMIISPKQKPINSKYRKMILK